MKCQDLFSLKKKKKSSAAVVIGAFRVNTMLSADSAEDKLMRFFFSFSQKNRIQHFMQTVS